MKFKTPSLGEDLERILHRVDPEGEAAAFSWLADDLNRSGVVGNARHADAIKGQQLVSHYGEALADVIRDTKTFPLERLV